MNESLPDGVAAGEDVVVPEFVADEPVAAAPSLDCWRCGKGYGAALSFSPICRPARRDLQAPPAGRRPPPTAEAQAPDMVRLFGVFSALLATSVVYGCFIRFGLSRDLPRDDESDRVTQLLVIELVDVVLVLAALVW